MAKQYWLIQSTEVLQHNWGFLSDRPLAVLDAPQLKKEFRNECWPLYSSLHSYSPSSAQGQNLMLLLTVLYFFVYFGDVLISTKTIFLARCYCQKYSTLTKGVRLYSNSDKHWELDWFWAITMSWFTNSSRNQRCKNDSHSV